MFLFLKQLPAAERIIKRNPFFYSEFRQTLDAMEGAGLAARRATAERLRARAVGWARQLPGYRGYDFARPFSELPLLAKARLQNALGGYDGRQFQFRVWWVRDYSAKNLKHIPEYILNRKVWNPTGGMTEWLYVKKGL